MQLKQLQTFVAIAETGSFHAAAERMCVTQAAVSMQIKNLEAALQLELFDRTVRPPRLSNSGELMLQQAQEIVQLCEGLRQTSPVAGQLKGSIKIGTIPGASFILPEALDDLRTSYRQLQVQVSSNLTNDLATSVLQGRLDAAVVTTPPDLDQDLLSRPLLSEALLVLAAKDCAGRSDADLLRSQPYISFNRKAEVSRMIELELRRRSIVVNPIMELDTLDTFQMMVLRGLGVGILPISSIRERFLKDFYLVPFGTPVLQRKVSMIQRRRHRRQIFLDTLYGALSKVADRWRAGDPHHSYS